jgi:mono/diheme cytochrome c family protein
MQDFRNRLAVVLIALIIFIPTLTWAGDDAASIYKTKCAVCHGADGLANTPMGKKQSIPSFASDKVQKSSDADVQDFILNGGKEKKASHAFSGKGISTEDAKKLATYIKELGKKK